jgi:hypothetical protein
MAESPEDFNKRLSDTAQSVDNTLRSISSNIGDIFKSSLREVNSATKSFGKDVQNQLSEMARSTNILVENQVKMKRGALSVKDVSKQILDYEIKREVLQKKINNLMNDQEGLASRLAGDLEALNEENEAYLNGLKEQEKILKKLGSDSGGLGKMSSMLKNTPGLDKMVGGFKLMNLSAEGIAAYLINAGFKADVQITKLAKSLTQTKFEAAQTRDNLAGMARESGDNFVTTEKLVESTVKLGQQLGIAQTFSADLTKEFTSLTGKMGLSEESAGGLAKLTVAMGKDARTVTTEALGTAQALEAQAGIQLDNRQILEEVGKVSGQLLANFKGNPAAIAAAVTQTKLLGTTLEQTKKQSESLLDFQSSIENELKAELMTGQQLNLERARALALSGDQAGVAKELANQNMNFSKFSQMNVLAQKDFAAALGLSADELTNQLLKQQYLGKSTKEVAALAGEDVANRLEALTAQDKFNNAVEKLQDIFVSLIDGPIGQFLNLLGDMLGIIGKIGEAFSKAIPAPILKILAGVGTGAAVGSAFGGIGALPGAVVGGLLAAGGVAANANDLISGYGQRTLSTPQGSYALNNNDTVIAGTNLFRGNDVYSGPAGDLSLGGGGAVVDAIAKLGDRINQLSERPVIARPSEFATPITIKQQQNIRRSI